MKVIRFLIVLVCLAGVATVVVADDEKDKEKERTVIRQMSHKTLTRLYKEPFQGGHQESLWVPGFQQHGD